MEVEDSDEAHIHAVKGRTRKRKTYGRLTDVSKKLNLQSHETGENCNCKRFRCFDNVPPEARRQIITKFNLIKSVDEQNVYLCGLISVCPVQQRRPRLGEDTAKFHDCSYYYKVRFTENASVKEIRVCQNAFLSLHGIRKKKLEVLQVSLKKTGSAPTDKRGRHKNRPLKLKPKTEEAIQEHIKSFKGRQSHYSMHDSKKIYLSEDLNIKKMFGMFLQKYENQGHSVSYETYRKIFCRDFNISFGYPRSDTCSICDEYQAKVKSLEFEKSKASDAEKLKIEKELKRLEVENKVHKVRAAEFYNRKRKAKYSSKINQNHEAVCMDFAKNLPVPNLTTNDVYYKRQFNVYSFNIHVLSTADSVFYMYGENIGAKGSDNVCSLLHNFVYNVLSTDVRHLEIFCDSCGGQNKNYTVIRYVHHLVHIQKRFDSVKMSFPVRGHSYLECDKNFGLINQKAHVELPNEWAEVFKSARHKPKPFEVIEVTQDLFREWSKFFHSMYRIQCPFPTRPIRELKVVKDHPRFVYHRSSWNGMWESAVIVSPKRSKKTPKNLSENQFTLPGSLYKGKTVRFN